MSINIERLKDVVKNPLGNSRHYHGDAETDLLDILDNYIDAEDLESELDCLRARIDELSDELLDKCIEVATLEKQVEKLTSKLAEYEA